MTRGTACDGEARARPGWAALEVWSLTTIAHTAAGGSLPSVAWLGGLALLVTAATTLVLRASVTTWSVLPALVAAQVGLHLGLSSLPSAPMPRAHELAGHAGMADSAAAGLTWPMLVAHLTSALLTAAVWSLRRRALERLRRLALPCGLVLPLAVSPVAHRAPEPTPLPVWLIGGPRRGPPRALVAA